eukprot:CAMPEP_0198700312 /NCGR_PEP_ID=MMETSP1468-20131203/367594_1 /TAXON_ID=1461545 /ORGANISM="Mantoniella sp, Strain CCMP1436" /LENGTH=38 /DNA_ID= /DNA_START= /DNA_END= /DNA_ORIENTATION=
MTDEGERVMVLGEEMRGSLEATLACTWRRRPPDTNRRG